MKTFLALVRREAWEHTAIWLVPVVLSAVLVVVAGIASVKLLGGGMEIVVNSHDVETDQIFRGLSNINLAMVVVFGLVMGVVATFYLLDCLLADRKDRSILFWKSLPISDLTTVLSKLATAAVLIPLVTLIGGFITAFVLMLVVSVDLLILGGSPWNLLWSNVPYFSNLILVLYAMVVGVLWYLPLMGYLMLVSAFAKRAVMMWAVLPPLVIALIETQFLGSDNFAEMLGERMNGFWLLAFHADALESMGEAMDRGHAGPGLEVINIAPFLQSPGLWLGLVAAGAFIAGAVYLRRYRDESL
jgi:ABC-2 type transport system permease protein